MLNKVCPYLRWLSDCLVVNQSLPSQYVLAVLVCCYTAYSYYLFKLVIIYEYDSTYLYIFANYSSLLLY